MARFRIAADVGLFLVCALVSSWWCLGASSQLGPTYDETFYVDAGLNCWNSLNHKTLAKSGTMPLPIELETLPLFILQKRSNAPSKARARSIGF